MGHEQVAIISEDIKVFYTDGDFHVYIYSEQDKHDILIMDFEIDALIDALQSVKDDININIAESKKIYYNEK